MTEPARRIATVTLLVADYDDAIAWYTQKLGFSLLDDIGLGDDKRWVMVAPATEGVRLLLARASDAAQMASVGNQTGGRVAFFLETDDFAHDHAAMLAKGVRFMESPRHEPYGIVAVFADLCGNLWDLIEPRR